MEIGARTKPAWHLPISCSKHLLQQRCHGFTTDERRRGPQRDEQDGLFDPVGLQIAINLTPPFSTKNQVAFIKQEALEKAREIRVKADEEFAIEKVVVTVKWDRGSTDGLLRFIGEAR